MATAIKTTLGYNSRWHLLFLCKHWNSHTFQCITTQKYCTTSPHTHTHTHTNSNDGVCTEWCEGLTTWSRLAASCHGAWHDFWLLLELVVATPASLASDRSLYRQTHIHIHKSNIDGTVPASADTTIALFTPAGAKARDP